MNLLLQGSVLRRQDHVAEKLLSGIVGSQVAELSVVCLGLVHLSLLEGQIGQLVEQALADGGALEGQEQNVLGVLVLLISLVDLSHHSQKARASHAAPVDGIGDLHRRLVVSLVHQFLDLFNFYVELVLIHLLHLSNSSILQL